MHLLTSLDLSNKRLHERVLQKFRTANVNTARSICDSDLHLLWNNISRPTIQSRVPCSTQRGPVSIVATILNVESFALVNRGHWFKMSTSRTTNIHDMCTSPFVRSFVRSFVRPKEVPNKPLVMRSHMSRAWLRFVALRREYCAYG